ncbi:DUF5320 domain-containing protein [Sedimentibacter hydroxybenzoicus DSM 7310]|uniref:DUF5320 domain-containing protein n=1 Tax=Sedimentibacter hydroxybenzoicus DSM 7310 TaxID=1123245 RepID=A0A974GXX1_SEDHY|nr:DUF5320 domain-containing protein [Sedimentibacter hydroxybenzoicus]NYB75998.1 DUF5320 domain-containing protein [Sedimentibacter hydroxybenzoicus DSM 7310]
MPGRYGARPMYRGFGYGRGLGYDRGFCRDGFRKSGCFGYRIGYSNESRKEFLQDQKDFLKGRLEEIDAELEKLN